MLTFVLASGVSGGGDFFGELQRWLGGRRGAPELATLYGKEMDFREVNQLKERRRLANEFMQLAVQQAQGNAQQDVAKNVPEFDDIYKNQLQNLSFSRQLAQLGYGTQEYERQLGGFLRQLGMLKERLLSSKKTTEADKIQRLSDLLQRDILRTEDRDELYPGSNLYFGGSLKLDGLINFQIWQHEADRLGIRLSTDDVKALIKRETLGLLTKDDSVAIQRYMRLETAGATQTLLAALGDEFRARLAQGAMTGYDPEGIVHAPAAITPQELWDYYLKNRTEVNLKVLPVPVSKFESQVKAQPTEAELKDLYEKYKDVEYAPDRDTPGFKLPRRIRTQWVEASPTEPYYQTAARNALLGLVAALPGRPLEAAALGSHFLGMYREAQQSFESYKWNYLQAPPLTEPDFARAFYTFASMGRPETAASVVGKVGGALGTWGTALSPVVGQQAFAVACESTKPEMQAAVRQEAQRRAALLGGLVSAGTKAAPLLALPSLLLGKGQVSQTLPLAVVQPLLLRQVENNLANEFLTQSLDDFKKDLESHRADPQKFIQEQVKKHHWQTGETSELRNRYDIAKDPGLKPLKVANLGKERAEDQKAEQQFADRLFSDVGPAGVAKLYAPTKLDPRFGETQTFLYWTTEDKPPEMQSFEQARKEAEAAWRLEQARPLAKAEADRIAAEARKAAGGAVQNLTDAAKKLDQNVIDLNSVAQLVTSPVARAGFTSQLSPYQLPDKIRYPIPDFVSEVLKLQQPGDVTVVTDQPKVNYYVAALTSRIPPSMKEFQQGLLLDRFEQERRTKYRAEVLDHLREQARLQVNEDRRKEIDERGSLAE
jgi:hypothetical protein